MIRRLFKLGMYASALSIGALIAGATFTETVVGSGVPATEERDVAAVTEVEFSGNGQLLVIPGDTPSLTITGDDNVVPLIESDVSGRKLKLRVRSGYSVRTSTPIKYTLTVPKLSKLSVSGSGNAQVERMAGETVSVRLSGAGSAIVNGLECKALSVTVSGSGNAKVSGTAQSVKARVSGAGEFHGIGVQAKAADVQVSGSGNVSVWAAEKLKARASGAGNVNYKGNPQVEQRSSGAGKVRPTES